MNDTVSEIGVHIANPSNKRSTVARIPIPHSKLELRTLDDYIVETDIICHNPHAFTEVDGEESYQGCYMHFKVDFNTYGGIIYIIRKTEVASKLQPIDDQGFSTDIFDVKVHSTYSDFVITTNRVGSDKTHILHLEYLFYWSYDSAGQPSGAYVFRPFTSNEEPKEFNIINSFEIYTGRVVSQIHIHGTQFDTILTFDDLSDFIQIEHHLIGLPLEFKGQEIVVRLTLEEMYNQGIFYTDSMGQEMQRRELDERDTWDLIVTEPISGNYYPINHGIYLQDYQRTFQVLNDRAQGGTSLNNGQIEIMLQRRVYKDDNKGLVEPLNEFNPYSDEGLGPSLIATHYVRFFYNSESDLIKSNARMMQREIDMPLMYIYGMPSGKEQLRESMFYQDSATNDIDLPDEVKMLIQPQKDNTWFVRLENINDCNEYINE